MKEYIIENKKTITIITIFIIFIIILEIIVNLLGNNNKILVNSYIKKLNVTDINLSNTSCNFDYVLKNNNIPYFQVSNPTYDKINQEILEDFLLRACYQDGQIDYYVSLNNNILSLALSISYETIDDLAYLEYKTYNIDIDTNQIMNNQDILNKFNLTIQDVNNKILNKLTEYYNYEINNELLDKGITFNQFLLLLNYENINLNNLNLYIDNKNDLYLYKDYTLTEGMILDEDYPNLSIKFKIN